MATFGTSLKWPLEELQFLELSTQIFLLWRFVLRLSLTYIYKAAQKSVMTLVYSDPHIFVFLCFHIQNFFNMLKFIYYLLNKLIIELRDKYIILLLYY